MASKRLGPLPRRRGSALAHGCGRSGRGALPLARAAVVSTRLSIPMATPATWFGLGFGFGFGFGLVRVRVGLGLGLGFGLVRARVRVRVRGRFRVRVRVMGWGWGWG